MKSFKIMKKIKNKRPNYANLTKGSEAVFTILYFFRDLKIETNKLECFLLTNFSSLDYRLWVRPGTYRRVEHRKGASFGKAPTLLANIRLSWKDLPGANTLASWTLS